MLTPNRISSNGTDQLGDITVHSANSPSSSRSFITPPNAQSWHLNPNATPFSKSTRNPPKRKPKCYLSSFIHRSPTQNPNPREHSLRSSGALYAERSYLLSSLEHENVKAEGLLHQIPLLEKGLAQDHHGARKIRKQIGWLKSRLGETTKQENILLQRVRQLTHEIQSRERCTQMDNERRELQCLEFMGLPQVIGGLQLNTATPEFHPQAPCPRWSPVQWSAQQQPASYGGLNCQGIALAPEFEWQKIPPTPFQTENSESQDRSEEDVSPIDAKGANGELLRPLLPHRPASFNDAKLEVLETCTKYLYPPAATLKLKRQSLPGLPGCPDFWAPTLEEQALEKT
jgi:hypothetical protein